MQHICKFHLCLMFIYIFWAPESGREKYQRWPRLWLWREREKLGGIVRGVENRKENTIGSVY